MQNQVGTIHTWMTLSRLEVDFRKIASIGLSMLFYFRVTHLGRKSND